MGEARRADVKTVAGRSDALRVGFANFWTGFDNRRNLFYRMLQRRYEVEVSDNPDLLIFSCFGDMSHIERHSCVRLFYTGECLDPDAFPCDFSISFKQSIDTNFFLPNFFIEHGFEWFDWIRRGERGRLDEKTGFCCFVASNPRARWRKRFARKLNRYKTVDSAGRVFANVPYSIPDRSDLAYVRWIAKYKFMIAFENRSEPGYTTEKIFYPLMAGTVPIYWGNPGIGDLFSEASFINAHRFRTLRGLVDHVRKVDEDPARYQAYLDANPLKYEFREVDFEDFLEKVARSARSRVGR